MISRFRRRQFDRAAERIRRCRSVAFRGKSRAQKRKRLLIVWHFRRRFAQDGCRLIEFLPAAKGPFPLLSGR